MKIIALFGVVCLSLVAVGQADDDDKSYCHTTVEGICQKQSAIRKGNKEVPLTNCTATYGAFKSTANELQTNLQKYVNLHILHSYHHLIMATYYGYYVQNRPGFEKLFRGLSDSLWEDSIDLIKYIAKRGGEMNFDVFPQDLKREKEALENYELRSVANALDFEKELAKESFGIHKKATESSHYDPEISSHIEQTYMHKHRDVIRKLAGHVTDLNSFRGQDHSLALFLFDEYLQKE